MTEKKLTWQDAVVDALQSAPTGIEFEAKVTIVPSKSDSHDFHYILEFGKFELDPRTDSEHAPVFRPSGPPVCASTCRGFRYRDTCTHVREHNERKGETDGDSST